MKLLHISRRCRGRWMLARFLLHFWFSLDVEIFQTRVVTELTIVRVWWIQLGPIAFGYGRGRRRHVWPCAFDPECPDIGAWSSKSSDKPLARAPVDG